MLTHHAFLGKQSVVRADVGAKQANHLVEEARIGPHQHTALVALHRAQNLFIALSAEPVC